MSADPNVFTEDYRHFMPELPPEDLPKKLSVATFLDELRAFAYNNRAFRDGHSDKITLASSEGDIEPTYARPTKDYTEVTYEFSAYRRRPPRPQDRPHLLFNIAMVITRSNIDLPPYIAQDAYGFEDPEQAVASAGSASFEQRIEFVTSTATRTLSSEEVFTYTDGDNDMLSQSSNCDDHNHPWLIQTSHETTEGEEDEDDADDLALLVPVKRDDREVITDISKAEADFIDQTLAELDQEWTVADAAEKEDADLRMAYAAFVLFKRGLRTQLGL